MGNSFNTMIFHPPPQPQPQRGQTQLKLDFVSGVAIKIITPRVQTTDKVIIYSYGNACDIRTTTDLGQHLAEVTGAVVVLYDYPGYGYTKVDIDNENSCISAKTTPSEQGCVSALGVVVEHCQRRFSGRQLILVGWSLGSGVTAAYAHKVSWQSPIVLVSAFKSICRVAVSSDVIAYGVELCTQNMFTTQWYAPRLKCPVRLVHGTDDALISIDHSKTLHTLLKHPLEPIWKRGQDHIITLGATDFAGIL